MDSKIESEVYVKHFGKKLKIENVFVARDKETKYVYQISYQEITYILKGFKIQVGHIDPENKKGIEIFEQMSEMFQDYYFARAASLLNPHIAKPLSLNLTVELPKDQTSLSYLHAQIIFERDGRALDELQPTTIEQTYKKDGKGM